MLPRLLTATLLVSVLIACGRHPRQHDAVLTEPVSGLKTVVTVADLHNVELVAARDNPEGLGTLSIRGKPIVGYTCLPDGSCDISVFGGNIPDVTVRTLPNRRGLKEVEVDGSEWLTWDRNADGQMDTRVGVKTHQSEIWLDGRWVLMTIAGNGTHRKYFAGGREVVFLAKRMVVQWHLTIHSSRTRFVALRLRLASWAGRLNSGVREHAGPCAAHVFRSDGPRPRRGYPQPVNARSF